MTTCSTAFSQPSPEDVSKELDYIAGTIDKGISDGNMALLSKAHRTLSNLELSIKRLENDKEKVLFTISQAYDYINLCPTSIVLQLSETTNPTGFSFDCIERTEYFFQRAIWYAQSVDMNKTTVADISFLIGIGYDQMKSNLATLSEENTKRFHGLAMYHVKKAIEIGTGFDGAKTILKRMEDEEYKTKPVITREQYLDLHRLLYLNRVLPKPFFLSGSSQEEIEQSSKEPRDDKNLFIDYQWRFSAEKPGENWQFVIRKSPLSLHLSILQKDPNERIGSGLNIVCRVLPDADRKLVPEALIKRSVEMLKEAGYNIQSQKTITHSGIPSQEIISVHKYKNLVQKKQGQDAENIVSKQYMIITVANGIEYVISFNSLEIDYSRIFPDYKKIAASVSIF